jgi:hypothetical protein
VTSPRQRHERVSLLALSKGIDQGALFASSLGVAWMIGPREFSALAALLVFSSLAAQLSNLGLGFVIHGSALTAPLPGRSVWCMRVGGAIVLLAGVVAALVAGSLLWLAAALIWWLSAEAHVRKVIALRDDRIARVLAAEAGGAILCLAVALGGTAGGWTTALAGALVCKHAAELVVLSRLRFEADPALRAPLGPVLAGQAMTFAASNIDYAVVGLVLAPESFSVYVIAFRLVSAVPALVSHAITQDTFVRLAASDRPDWGEVLRSSQRTALAVGVVGGVLGAGGGWLGELALGREWTHLGWTCSALAVAVPARLLIGPAVALLIRSGRPGLVIRAEAVRAGCTASAAGLGTAAGVVGAGAGTALGAVLGGAFLCSLALRRADEESRTG